MGDIQAVKGEMVGFMGGNSVFKGDNTLFMGERQNLRAKQKAYGR